MNQTNHSRSDQFKIRTLLWVPKSHSLREESKTVFIGALLESLESSQVMEVAQSLRAYELQVSFGRQCRTNIFKPQPWLN